MVSGLTCSVMESDCLEDQESGRIILRWML